MIKTISEKQLCPECGHELKYIGQIPYGGLGHPNRLVKGYRCKTRGCPGNPDERL